MGKAQDNNHGVIKGEEITSQDKKSQGPEKSE